MPPHALRQLGRSAVHVAGWASVFIFVLDRVGSLASVEGRSMQPTLNPDENRLARDVLLLNKYILSTRKWGRGDVVTLRSPMDPDHIIAKRIVALEDDYVVPDPRCSFVRRNGLRPGQSMRVPKGHCWVEGDAGMHSRDSQDFGPVPLGLLTAKVSAVVWPPNRVRWVDTDVARAHARTAVVTREAVQGHTPIV
ncbi:hypothetical protein H9P43_001189 [Blastocladiella emersonii ATCC 22665]|nr:hypothetical protein H9P43_001189 [Blastocladiella emersonii ATCC 22665]